MNEVSDEQLIVAAQHDSEAFGVLYQKYVHKIYSFILYRVNQQVDIAEDLTAEVFTRALGTLNRFQWQGYPYSTYLYQVARSICLDYYKKPTMINVDEIEVSGTTATDLSMQVDVRLLWEKISRFDVEIQEIFSLRFLQGLSYEIIGEILQKKPGAIRTIVSRTITKLQAEYGQ